MTREPFSGPVVVFVAFFVIGAVRIVGWARVVESGDERRAAPAKTVVKVEKCIFEEVAPVA